MSSFEKVLIFSLMSSEVTIWISEVGSDDICGCAGMQRDGTVKCFLGDCDESTDPELSYDEFNKRYKIALVDFGCHY